MNWNMIVLLLILLEIITLQKPERNESYNKKMFLSIFFSRFSHFRHFSHSSLWPQHNLVCTMVTLDHLDSVLAFQVQHWQLVPGIHDRTEVIKVNIVSLHFSFITNHSKLIKMHLIVPVLNFFGHTTKHKKKPSKHWNVWNFMTENEEKKITQ